MSVLIKGLRARSNDVDRKFGYLAFFEDGDVRKHTTNFPKTHCVRATTASWKRWQSEGCYQMGGEVWNGLHLIEFKGGFHVYEWFKSEAEAILRVKQALALTRFPLYDPQIWGRSGYERNREWENEPYWASVQIVPGTVVWDRGDTLDTLRGLNDPRLVVGTGKYVPPIGSDIEPLTAQELAAMPVSVRHKVIAMQMAGEPA